MTAASALLRHRVTAALASASSHARVDACIGLCGGIASGKSSARKFLTSLGCICVDADALAHEAYAKGSPTHALVAERFPTALAPSGDIDRKALGAIVFGNPAALAQLNSIVWPAVEALVEVRLASLVSEAAARDDVTPRIAVVEAALLLEAGWGARMDEIWLTHVPPEEAVRRIQERNGITEDAARARVAAQRTNEDRALLAEATGRYVVSVSTDRAPHETQAMLRNELERLQRQLQKAAGTAAAAV